MGNLQELLFKELREESLKVLKENPCLFIADVEGLYQKVRINLGIKANRSKRPALSFRYLPNRRQFCVVFLTRKENGEPTVDLELCTRKCDEFPRWEERPRVFKDLRTGRKVFRIKEEDLTDSKLFLFCSTCKKEITHSLKELEE
jgi:hypothetical protein